MICCPSFDPEWVITVVREGETELFPGSERDYFVEYAGAEENLWYAKKFRKVAVTRARVSLDRETAEAVSKVWHRMLRMTRDPEKLTSGVEDGVIFHFSRDVPPSIYRGWQGPPAGIGEGRIHPSGDDRLTGLTGELAAIGVDLKSYALIPPEGRDRLKTEIRGKVDRLMPSSISHGIRNEEDRSSSPSPLPAR